MKNIANRYFDYFDYEDNYEDDYDNNYDNSYTKGGTQKISKKHNWN
jgi:hypothetical protein